MYEDNFTEREELAKRHAELVDDRCVKPSKSPSGASVHSVHKNDGGKNMCKSAKALGVPARIRNLVSSVIS